MVNVKWNELNIYEFWLYLGSLCSAFFDRIACWPPTEPGVRRSILCPSLVFPDASLDGRSI
jgi:hypothetical protein